MIELDAHQLDEIATIARNEAGLHLPATKAIFVASRLQRRLRATGSDDFNDYLALAHSNNADGAAERMLMVSALTTNVTGLYREAHHFRILSEWLETVRGAALARRTPLTIWSAGCATGEEPLSIAATCHEVIGHHWKKIIRILATDVDAEALKIAASRREEDYDFHLRLANSKNIVTSKETDYNSDFLDQLQDGIEYRRHNVLDRPPKDDGFDVVFCRNVTIYFDRIRQAETHRLLAHSTKPNGLLALGHSERLATSVDGLSLVGPTIYRRVGISARYI